MAGIHITEAEFARDVHGVLSRVQSGVEIVVDRDEKPVAVLSPPTVPVRKISEIIASMEAAGACTIPDEYFARDVEAGIAMHNVPWNPPSWD